MQEKELFADMDVAILGIPRVELVLLFDRTVDFDWRTSQNQYYVGLKSDTCRC